jgi:hypothetical protein
LQQIKFNMMSPFVLRVFPILCLLAFPCFLKSQVCSPISLHAEWDLQRELLSDADASFFPEPFHEKLPFLCDLDSMAFFTVDASGMPNTFYASIAMERDPKGRALIHRATFFDDPDEPFGPIDFYTFDWNDNNASVYIYPYFEWEIVDVESEDFRVYGRYDAQNRLQVTGEEFLVDKTWAVFRDSVSKRDAFGNIIERYQTERYTPEAYFDTTILRYTNTYVNNKIFKSTEYVYQPEYPDDKSNVWAELTYGYDAAGRLKSIQNYSQSLGTEFTETDSFLYNSSGLPAAVVNLRDIFLANGTTITSGSVYKYHWDNKNRIDFVDVLSEDNLGVRELTDRIYLFYDTLQSSAVKTPIAGKGFKISPNPASPGSLLQFGLPDEVESDIIGLDWFSADGRMVVSQTYSGNAVTPDLPDGVFFLSVRLADGRVGPVQKVVVFSER